MRTTIINSAIAGAACVTGLLGLASAAQADVGTAAQVRSQVAQPMPEDDLRVADPEGAPVRAGPGPEYGVVYQMDYGDPVLYDATPDYAAMPAAGGQMAEYTEYTEMTDPDGSSYVSMTDETTSAAYSPVYVVQQATDAIGPSTSETAWLDVDNGYVWLGDVEPGQ